MWEKVFDNNFVSNEISEKHDEHLNFELKHVRSLKKVKEQPQKYLELCQLVWLYSPHESVAPDLYLFLQLHHSLEQRCFTQRPTGSLCSLRPFFAFKITGKNEV